MQPMALGVIGSADGQIAENMIPVSGVAECLINASYWMWG
jgi:hypothetical protein